MRRLDASSLESTILCYGADFYTQRPIDRPDAHVVHPPNHLTSISFLTHWFTFVKYTPHVIVFIKGPVDAAKEESIA